MSINNPGLVIESFAIAAKNKTFNADIDRHHPDVAWAQASVSGSNSSLTATKDHLNTAVSSLQYTLRKEEDRGALAKTEADNLQENLTILSEKIKEATSPNEIGESISNAQSFLNQIFPQPDQTQS